MVHDTFAFSMTLKNNYQMVADFEQDGVADLLVDEKPPLGEGKGPNPARVLGAAVGGCLSASLLFCLRKAHFDVKDLATRVEGEMERNESGRLRIKRIQVRLSPAVDPEERERMGRCLELFENFCIVTESVRQGIAVDVAVEPAVAETLAS